MKNTIVLAMSNFGFSAAVWFGFVEGIEGAQYVVKFFVWAVAFPSGFICLSDNFQKSITQNTSPGCELFIYFRKSIEWFSLSVLVWTGNLFTAAAWGFFMLSLRICVAGMKKHLAGL